MDPLANRLQTTRRGAATGKVVRILAAGQALAIASLVSVSCGTGSQEGPGSTATATSTTKPPPPVAPSEKLPRAAQVLARLSHVPHEVAVDDSSVYVIQVDIESEENSPSSLVKIPKSGGSPVSLTDRQMAASGLVLGGGKLFWTVAGDLDRNISDAVMAMPTTGGKPSKVGNTLKFATSGLTSDSKFVYFGDHENDAAKLKRVPFSGGTEEVIQAEGIQGSVSAIAVDSKRIHWAADRGIVSLPVSGGRTVSGVQGKAPVRVGGLASDGEHLYWTDWGRYTTDSAAKGTLHRVPVGGGADELIAEGLRGRPWGIVVDDTHVYAIINAEPDGGIVRVTKSGGQPVFFVTGQNAATHIAQDSRFVYWANSGDKVVMRAPK